MENSSFSEDTKLLKVINIDVLTASPDVFTAEKDQSGIEYTEIPLLNFELENGENFLMASIPISIAIDISRIISGVNGNDSRLTLAELIPEICVVEKIIIDSIIPYSNAYQATVEIRLEGFSDVQHFQMVPSHATLLALLANADIYVSENIIRTIDNLEDED